MKAFVLSSLCLASITYCVADDAAITFGGSPKMLKGHPTVRMVRERVLMTIGKEDARYDCTFVFHNDGPTCRVRIGFPDQGEGAEETAHDEDVAEAKEKGKPEPAYSKLKHFRSYVDGKEVPTELVAVHDSTASWHAKTVRFAAGQTIVVRDTFDGASGFGMTASGKGIEERRYIMSTGASWKGPIGEAEVIVKFQPDIIDLPIKPFSERKLVGRGKSGYQYERWAKLPKNAVVWAGFAKPTLSGRELRFHRKNFNPTSASDISILFGWGRSH